MPEITWWWSQAGPTAGYRPWSDAPLNLAPGAAIWVRVAATSDKDAEVVDAFINFVASTKLHVARYKSETSDYEHLLIGAENSDAGLPPGYEVQFSAIQQKWLAAHTWMGVYLVIIPADLEGEFTLLYEIAAGKELSSKRLLSIDRWSIR